MYAGLIGFISCIFIIWLFHPLAMRLQLMDYPGGRKHHKQPAPLVGGIAMFIGFTVSLLVLPISLSEYRSLIAASTLLVLIGILDDLHEISPRWRFLAQLVAGLLMGGWGDILLHELGDLFSFGQSVKLGKWSLLFTLLSTIGIINAINMIDGLDGLAGSLVLIAFCFLGYLAWQAGLQSDFLIINLFISVVLGFLMFNFPCFGRVSKIFMGDAGSMLLGFGLVWFLVALSQGQSAAARPVDMLWLVAIPLFDLVSVASRRLLKQQSPFIADREHLHHLLLALGLTSQQVVYLLSSSAISLSLIGLIGSAYGVAESIMFIAFLILFFIYFISVTVLWRKIKQQKTTSSK